MPAHDAQPVPLNEIQRTMLRWNSVHPYNVVDLVEVLRPVTEGQMRAAAEVVLGELGLGVPFPDNREKSAVFLGSPDGIEVSARPLGTGEKTALESFLSEELNRPFDVGRDAALRLTCLQGASQRFVAMTYQHWVMDGTAAARVFRRILAEALGLPREHGSRTELETPSCDRSFAHRRQGIPGLAQKLEGLRGLLTRTRATAPWQSVSPECRSDVRMLTIPQDSLDRLRRMARQNGCTVNDCLLATIIRAIGCALPEHKRHAWRRNIAICNIADLRRLNPELGQKSGVYVGFFGTHLGALPREDAPLIDLIRRQTSRAKRLCMPLASLATFRAIPRLWPLLPAETLSGFLRTFFRYSAGLSNLRLGPEWDDPTWSRVVRGYTRACPLGMMLPLIFGVTTQGSEMTVTVTWARGGYSPEQIDNIASRIRAFLETA